LTLDDILRHEINPNVTLKDQPFSVKISATLTMIMLVAGLINSVFSILTFQNAALRKVGCGMYLLASSITSLLTICMFTVKFWFVVLTQTSTLINLSVLQGGCKSIELLLKLFFYLNAWLNACVAIERAFHVLKGVNFDKEMSKSIARWIILTLPFCIMATIIHEPLYRNVFEYNAPTDETSTNETRTDIVERHTWCVTYYSRGVQDYNTAILFIHLLGPFIFNLFSALLVIFGTARRRSVAHRRQSFKKHSHEQWKKHKQLVISPAILLGLSIPRLIISLLSGCIDASRHPGLYLSAYFISFTPTILIFVVLIIPSDLYRRTFEESFRTWRQRIHQ
jgi:uncharacterized membrane protein